MRSSILASAISVLALTSAAPFSPFPLADGFPSPNQAQLAAIEKGAGGTLPNTPPPSKISPEGITNLKLIAFAETFEVAYFTQLYQNVTNNVTGYAPPKNVDKAYLETTLKKIIDQEQLHALDANMALKAFNITEIQPCQYQFPVTTLLDAVTLANTFTDIVVGTLQQANNVFAKNMDPLTQLIDSVIGQEGEQIGFFRFFQKKTPSASPFLTTGGPNLAFTAVQNYVVPGSCPNINTIPLKTFQPLMLAEKNVTDKNSTLHFSWKAGQTKPTNITYISGQNLPVTVPFKVESNKDGLVSVSAPFPFESGFSDGLTIAVATNGAGPFMNSSQVEDATIFGPAPIEVD